MSQTARFLSPEVKTDSTSASGTAFERFITRHRVLLQSLAIILGGIIAAMVWDGFRRWPEDLVIPAREWMTDFFYWLSRDAAIGSLYFKDITRGISWLLSWPLVWMNALLSVGIRSLHIPPLPWPVLIGGAAALGYWIAGWRLAIFSTTCLLFMVIFGLWHDAMLTLSIVLVAVPFAAGTGLFLGIWATRSPRVESALTAIFDLMQATPHMAYLTPIVVLFGFGQVPAMMATVAFAMPPMARCVILGLRSVPPAIIEAGRMVGSTPRQLLWRVELPAAHQTLMLGLNQVVMQTLAMAVIASLVGASGLGQKLLFSLQQLQIGKAVEQGTAIVLIAIVLDRLSHAYAYRLPNHETEQQSAFQRYKILLCFLGFAVVTVVLAQYIPALQLWPKDMAISGSKSMNIAVRWFSKEMYPYIQPVRDWVTVHLLLNLRNFYLWLPWPVLIGLTGYVGYRLAGLRLAGLVMALWAFIMLTGFWKPAMFTLYLVTGATILCVLIGVPIGIWASRNEKTARIIMSVCDTMQTFPSFIYLIPVIMLLKVGDLSNIIAILAFASVPSIRYTYLGMKKIPPATTEAAVASGSTKLQKLFKVELPIALPEIMLGINQTIMMALAMTAITALIGSRDLGQEIYKALPGADTGRGILAGLSIAAIGIIADRLIGAWAKRRKIEMGMH